VFATGEEMWDWVVNGNPIVGEIIGGLSEPQRTTMRQVLDLMLRERADAQGRATLNNVVNIAIGWK
jgi:hypothetical protein